MDLLMERYHCQMALPGFGLENQMVLNQANVLIVGMGGLGCPVAQYLVAAGIGHLTLMDDDNVSISNLNRQILYGPEDIGKPKVEVAKQKLMAQNPMVIIESKRLRLDASNALSNISGFDLVIDCTDNIHSKYVLNDACVLTGKPLVYGAIYQYEGQVAVWNVYQKDGTFSPNYRDVFPEIDSAHIPNCQEGGMIPPLAGIVGCMQANEALKFLLKSSDLISSNLLLIDLNDCSMQKIKLKKNYSGEYLSDIKVPIISYDELLKDAEKYKLIDVRSEAEHKEFNIGGLCLPLDRLNEHLEMLEHLRLPLVFYCHSGQRSSLALKIVSEKFPDLEVYSLKDGLKNLVLEK